MTRLSEPGEKTLPPGQSWAQLFRKDARGGGEREQRRREWWSRKDAPVAQAAREVEALHASTASEMIWPPLGVADPSESSHSSSSRQERFLSESLLRGGERTSRFPQNPIQALRKAQIDMLREERRKAEAQLKLLDEEQKRLKGISASAFASTKIEYRVSPVIRKGKRYSLPVLLDGHIIASTPDYGSNVEAIDHALAERLGLRITSSEVARKKVRLGNGDYLKPLGTVLAWIEFAKGPRGARAVTFSVFDKLVTGVQLVLGRRFLDETEILTKHRDWLDECRPNHSRVPRLMLMPGSARFLPCFLDNHKVYAAADTGSDVCLISGEYARRRRLNVAPVQEHERYLELPGLHLAEVSGKVELKFDTLYATKSPNYSRSISVASTVGNKANAAVNDGDHYQMFYVLPSLTCDVLLGEELLDSIDVFGCHLDTFVDCCLSDSNNCELKAIKWASRMDRWILKIANKNEDNLMKRDAHPSQGTQSICNFLQVEDNGDFDTQPKFRQALSLRDAEEWSRRRDAEAELRQMVQDEQTSTEILVKTRLQQEIAAFRQDEARLQDDYKLARLKAEKAWVDCHAEKHQCPSASRP